MWTVEKVKTELPSVRCRFNGTVYHCRTAGRKEQFCTVWAMSLQAIFTWEAVTRALNGDNVLSAD